MGLSDLFGRKPAVKIPFANGEYAHEDDFCARCIINAARDPKRCAAKCDGWKTIKERREHLEKGETLEQILGQGQPGPQFVEDFSPQSGTSHPEWLKGFIWASPFFHAKYIYRIHELGEDYARIAYTFSDHVNMIQLLQPFPNRMFTVQIRKHGDGSPEEDIGSFFADVKAAHAKHLEKVMTSGESRRRFGGEQRSGYGSHHDYDRDHGHHKRGGRGGHERRQSRW